MRSSPSQATLKRLFALSGNRCAFPGCGLPIVDPETGNLLGGPIHITATSPGGPRYDPRQTDEEKQDVKNLLLLCHKHHAVIDADPDVYSVDFLRGVKAAHEAYYPRGKEPNDAIAAGLQKSG